MQNNELKSIPLKNLFYLFSLSALTGSFLSIIPTNIFIIDLLAHFKLQYFWGLAFFSLVGLVYRRFRYSGILSIGVLVNLLQIAPIYFSKPVINEQASTRSLKLLHANVLSANNQHQLLIQQIKAESPDIVLLQEITADWEITLNENLTDYQYRKIIARPDNFGIAVFSRVELKTIEVKNWGNVDLPSYLISFEWRGLLAKIAYTHPLPPVNKEYFLLRNRQIEAMISEIENHNLPLIVAGDFNTTMWATSYATLHSRGLSNVRNGFDILPTWPSQLGSFGIPIDHILVSNAIAVKHTKTGDSIGSDHLPLITELSIN